MTKLLAIFFLFFCIAPAISSAERTEERERVDAMLAAAQTPEEKGMAIALEMDFRLDGVGDWSNDQKMIIKNARGEEKIREFRVKVLNIPDGRDKFLFIFDKPNDVRGVSQLYITQKNKADDVWIYIPALKRVKRITPLARLGSFMGSEFTNEDTLRQEASKFTYKWVRDEMFQGVKCYVIERYPNKHEVSGYSKWEFWVGQKEFNLRKVNLFNKRGEHFKTVTIHGFTLYLDDFWFWDEFRMTNHQTGKSTQWLFSNWKIRSGLKDSNFSLNALKRHR